MVATISFTFPASASYSDVIQAINLHYDARSDIGNDAPDVGARNAAEVFTGQHTTEPVRSAAAVFTGQPQLNVPVAQPANATAAVIRDAEGFPWDERIHSSNKQFTSKGVWTKRKGVSETTHNTVKLEMHQHGLVILPNTATTTPQPTGNQMAVTEDSTSPEYLEKVARLNWATEQTMIQLGQYPGPVENFDKLKNGTMVTVAPHEADWFKRYTEQVHALFTANAPQPAIQQAPYVAPVTQPAAYVPPGALNAPSGYAAPAPTPATATLDPNTYPGFAVFVSGAMADGRLTLAQLNQTIAQAGIVDGVGLAAVGKHVEMIPAVLALLEGFYQVRP